VIQLEKTINNLKHQLIDTENKLKLNQLDQEKLNKYNFLIFNFLFIKYYLYLVSIKIIPIN